MKKLFIQILSVIIIAIFAGCSDDSSPTDSGSGGFSGTGGTGSGGGTGGVSFTVRLVYDQSSQPYKYYFEFKPSTNVVINTISANCTAANINNEAINFDGTTIFSSTNPAYGEVDYDILAQGQQWTFSIAGKTGSAQGQAFTATANCLIN